MGEDDERSCRGLSKSSLHVSWLPKNYNACSPPSSSSSALPPLPKLDPPCLFLAPFFFLDVGEPDLLLPSLLSDTISCPVSPSQRGRPQPQRAGMRCRGHPSLSGIKSVFLRAVADESSVIAPAGDNLLMRQGLQIGNSRSDFIGSKSQLVTAGPGQEDGSGSKLDSQAYFIRQLRGGSKRDAPALEGYCYEEENSKSEKVSVGVSKHKALKTSKHLFAGAVSAIVSRTIVAPLERLKLEYIVRGATKSVFGTVHDILCGEGLRGFWKGNVVNLIRTAPFKSLNFFAYDTYRKQWLLLTGKKEVSNLEKLAAGAAAGITATLICFPMDTIRTRMVAPGGERLGGIIGCATHMIHTEGMTSLYKGLLPAIISMAPSGAVFYGVYDILKTSYLKSPRGQKEVKERLEREERLRISGGQDVMGTLEIGPLRTLLYGAIAGACAETATYPFEVVRRQLQMQNAASSLSVTETVRAILARGGVGALYAGLLPSTFQVLPSAALSYFVYETMKIVLSVE